MQEKNKVIIGLVLAIFVVGLGSFGVYQNFNKEKDSDIKGNQNNQGDNNNQGNQGENKPNGNPINPSLITAIPEEFDLIKGHETGEMCEYYSNPDNSNLKHNRVVLCSNNNGIASYNLYNAETKEKITSFENVIFYSLTNGLSAEFRLANDLYLGVYKDGKSGLIDRDGKIILDIVNDYQFELNNIEGDYIRVKKDGKYAIASIKTGKVVSSFYEDAGLISENEYVAKAGNLYYLYDVNTQKKKFEKGFSYIKKLESGIYMVILENGTFSILNSSGNSISNTIQTDFKSSSLMGFRPFDGLVVDKKLSNKVYTLTCASEEQSSVEKVYEYNKETKKIVEVR